MPRYRRKKVDPALLRELEAALEDEHCGECGSASCDINAAWDHGYPLWAANLLIGATECPRTEAALGAINPTHEELSAECDEFVENVPHVTCDACNAVVWESAEGDRPEQCDNCLGAVSWEDGGDEDEEEEGGEDEGEGEEGEDAEVIDFSLHAFCRRAGYCVAVKDGYPVDPCM